MDKLSDIPTVIGIWVRDEKHFYSEKAGYDIGVPDTVERTLDWAHELSNDPTKTREGFSGEMDRKLLWYAERNLLGTKEEWVCTYFFKEPLRMLSEPIDEHGKTLLEGELRRFVVRGREDFDPSEANGYKNVIRRYARESGLSEEFVSQAKDKLGVGLGTLGLLT